MSMYRAQVGVAFLKLPLYEQKRLREKYDFGDIATCESFLLPMIAGDIERYRKDRAIPRAMMR